MCGDGFGSNIFTYPVKQEGPENGSKARWERGILMKAIENSRQIMRNFVNFFHDLTNGNFT